jgi:hypothetical protein
LGNEFFEIFVDALTIQRRECGDNDGCEHRWTSVCSIRVGKRGSSLVKAARRMTIVWGEIYPE